MNDPGKLYGIHRPRKMPRYWFMLIVLLAMALPGSPLRAVAFGQTGDALPAPTPPPSPIISQPDAAPKIVIYFDSSAEARAVIPEARGLIIAGFSGEHFTFVRYKDSGRLDTKFGTDARVTTGFRASDEPRVAAVDADRRVIVAGYRGGNLTLTRYKSDGRPDTGFGTDGRIVTEFRAGSGATAVAIDFDRNRIVVAGYREGKLTLTRYKRDGQPDAGFGTDGRIVTEFRAGIGSMAVAVDHDSNVVVAGDLGQDFMLLRYRSNGELNTRFGAGGRVATGFRASAGARAVAVDSDEKIVVTGHREESFILARYRSNGKPDNGFGIRSQAVTAFHSSEEARAVAVDFRGSIVTAGSRDGIFTLTRHKFNGRPDSKFGGAGRVTTDFRDSDRAVTIEVAGKLIVAGFRDGKLTLVGYKSNGRPDAGFGTDGQVTPDFGAGAAGDPPQGSDFDRD